MRRGTLKARSRTQSSIAVSADGENWVLINASPDILSQIRATPALQPGRQSRDTGIAAVLLMDAQIDHVTGLLMLREGKPIPLYCTASVWDDLTTGLPLVPVLSHYCGVQWHPLNIRHDRMEAIDLPGMRGIRFTALAFSSKAPPYSPHRENPHPGDNIGLVIEDLASGKNVFYAPGLGEIEPHVEAAMRNADCLLVDGTFWHADEMIRLGFSAKYAADMGHLPQFGPGGMIECLDSMDAERKILIHINNTNPILDEDSEQHATLLRHGIEIAHDGMEITL
jgi:pyrroloquinoline quinone biosynthesis protein B